MRGLALDVFQQMLRPWVKPKGYRFKNGLFYELGGETLRKSEG